MKSIFNLNRLQWIGFLFLPYSGITQTLLHSFNTGYEYIGGPPSGIAINNLFYFQASASDGSSQIWQTDGTLANTSAMITYPLGSYIYGDYCKFNNEVYFLAEAPGIGRELWRSNGTPVGTYFVKDIRPGSATGFRNDQYSYDIAFVPRIVNGVMLFAANDGINGHELWRTDGTSDGTYLVKDIYSGSAGSSVSLNEDNSIQIANIVYFGANDSTGRSLYRTDGTTEGTYRLVSGFTSGWANVNGTFYFIKNSAPDQGLWKSDGTPEGTQFITDTGLNFASNVSSGIPVVNDNLFFYFGRTLSTAPNYVALFKSDGTDAGTHVVKDNIFGVNGIKPLNGKLFFWTPTTTASLSGFSFWSSDGTTAGTGIYKEHTVNTDEDSPISAYFLNDHLVYQWRMPGITGEGVAIWITDGTAGGTYPLKDYDVNNSSTFASRVHFINNKYCFLINGEIWFSDGTTAGIVQISQFRTMFGDTRVATDFVPFNSMLLLKNDLRELFSLSTCSPAFLLFSSTSEFICPETNVTLSTSNCNGTVSWNTGATGNNLVVAPTTTTTYTATCTENDCSNPKSITIYTVPATRTLSGTVVGGVIKSTQAISSSQIVPSGTNVNYQAGNSISLQATFQAQTGSVFKAEIKGCN